MVAETVRSRHRQMFQTVRLQSRRLAIGTVLGAIVITAGFAVRTAFAVENEPPEITYFSVSNPLENYWLFEGIVDDETPGACTIAFDGVLEGHYVDCDADGT